MATPRTLRYKEFSKLRPQRKPKPRKPIQGELFGKNHLTIKPTDFKEIKLRRLRLVPHLDMREIEPTYNLLDRIYDFMLERNKIPNRISEIEKEINHLQNLIKNNPQDPENIEMRIEIERLINYKESLKHKYENPRLSRDEKIILDLLSRLFKISIFTKLFNAEITALEKDKQKNPKALEHRYPISIGKTIDLALYHTIKDYNTPQDIRINAKNIAIALRKLGLQFQLIDRI